LGVQSITPLFTEYTQKPKSSQYSEKKQHHWNKLIIQACEQCQRDILPQLHPPQHLAALQLPDNEPVWFAHPYTDAGIPGRARQPGAPWHILIGPEGGFSDEEAQYMQRLNYAPLYLGPHILRAETAALASVVKCQAIFAA
jgi:16S rRNA (uracil1498-N3)-methyltransferase